MALARPKYAYRFALIATIASTLGGIAGYYLGYFAFDALARPVLDFYGKLMMTSTVSGNARAKIRSAPAGHLRPLTSATDQGRDYSSRRGADQFLVFRLSCIIARSAVLYPRLALRRYGDPIRDFIERRLGLIAAIAAGFLIVIYLVVKYSGLSGAISSC